MAGIDARAAWLADHATAIGSSESPILFNEGYAGTSVYRLWCEKLGLIPRDDLDNVETIRWGQRLEPVIADAVAEETGYHIAKHDQTEFLRHPVYAFIGATPDYRVFSEDREGPGILEIKNVGTYFAREWTDQPPLRVLCQVQHQLAVTGYKWGLAAGLVGGNRLKWHPFERHEKFIATLEQKCRDFWKLIETRTPPEVDGSEATTKVLLRLHPADNGLAVKLPADLASLYDELEQAAAEAAAATSRKDKLANRLRSVLGANTYGEFPGGQWCSWATSEVAGYVVKPRVQRTFRLHKSRPKDVVDYATGEPVPVETHQLAENVTLVGSMPEATKRRKKTGLAAASRKRLLQRDPHCHHCGCTLTSKTATLDHRVPLALGGADNETNYVLWCKKCNEAKGHKTPEEFVTTK